MIKQMMLMIIILMDELLEHVSPHPPPFSSARSYC